MDDVLEFCRRVLIEPSLAGEAAEAVAAQAQAQAHAPGNRLDALAAAGRACRERASRVPVAEAIAARSAESASSNGGPPDLAAAVARELAAASAQLAERHRETLALRELLGLSYEDVGAVIGVEPAAVGPLLARARLRLRVALRGSGTVIEAPCDSRDRALRALARRQDHQPMTTEDQDWLLNHLAGCPACARDHAAMLEASACYGGWRVVGGAASAEA
ncbi:MAG: sigma factor-like helix-turn-helix DNA-binding protein [Solirubrobacteraceae bacterium]